MSHLKAINSALEKMPFNANPHKYHVRTIDYQHRKRPSAIEMLAKQYSLPMTTRSSMGLVWYNPTNHMVNLLLCH